MFQRVHVAQAQKTVVSLAQTPRNRGEDERGYSPLSFQKQEKLFQRYKMSSLWINNAIASVAKDNMHLNFGRFIKLGQPKTWSKLRSLTFL